MIYDMLYRLFVVIVSALSDIIVWSSMSMQHVMTSSVYSLSRVTRSQKSPAKIRTQQMKIRCTQMHSENTPTWIKNGNEIQQQKQHKVAKVSGPHGTRTQKKQITVNRQ